MLLPLLQTNGLTERFNQTLSRCLAKVCNEDHTDWDLKIDTVLMDTGHHLRLNKAFTILHGVSAGDASTY